MQWLCARGCDSLNRYAIKYSAQSKWKLQSLHSLARFLDVDILIDRIIIDLRQLEPTEQEQMARDRQLEKNSVDGCAYCGYLM